MAEINRNTASGLRETVESSTPSETEEMVIPRKKKPTKPGRPKTSEAIEEIRAMMIKLCHDTKLAHQRLDSMENNLDEKTDEPTANHLHNHESTNNKESISLPTLQLPTFNG